MLLEDQRFIHEDLERLEQGIADRPRPIRRPSQTSQERRSVISPVGSQYDYPLSRRSSNGHYSHYPPSGSGSQPPLSLDRHRASELFDVEAAG